MQSAESNSSNVLTLASLDVSPSFNQHVSMIAVLTYLIILVCNITMVLVIALNKHLHKPMYVLLLNLHINDMMGATSIFPHLIHSTLTQSDTISYGACYLQALLDHLHCDAAHLILTVMAFDRYVAICQPLRYHAFMSGANLRRLIAAIWLTDVILVGSLFLMLTRLQLCRWRLGGAHCSNSSLVRLACGDTTANSVYSLTITVLIHGSTFVMVLFTYSHILVTCVLTRQADAWAKALRTCGTHLVVFLVFETTTLFFISYSLPGSVIGNKGVVDLTVMVISPVLNPLIYGLNTKEIRTTVLQAFHRKTSNKVSIQH